MWGSYSSSEAVQDCLSMASSYGPQHVHTMEPRPPYAVGKPRPLSAPVRKQIPADRWRDSYSDHMSLSHQGLPQQQSVDSRYAYRPKSHAGRQLEVINRENQMRMMSYPRMENGKKVYLPSYSSLSDPHLTDFYARKFGLEVRPPSTLAKRRASNGFRPHRPGSAKNGETVYKIEVKTGDKKGCGTSANVFISMKGEKGKFQKKKLTKKQTKTNSGLVHCKFNRNTSKIFNLKGLEVGDLKFNRNTSKIFNLKGLEVGDLKSLTIEHDGLEKKDSWFIEEVKVTNLHTKKSWLFFCSQWLSLFHNDCQISRNLKPVDAKKFGKTQYEIVVITGDVGGAGTDANVYITLFGARRSCSKFQLKARGKSFERGMSDIFTHKCDCVGPLKKIRIEHDNTGFSAGWFLERVVVTDLKNPKKSKYYFPCSMWLARDEGDKLISRDLLGSKDPLAVRKSQKYMVHVFTGNKRKAGTDANVHLTLFGEGGDSGEHKLNTSKNNFEKGSEDIFVVECPGLGALDKLRISHDNSGFGAAWFLDKVIVDDTSLNKTYKFPCNRWLAKDEDDGKISRELYCEGSGNGSRGIPYEVRVTTGDKRHAGTSAGVYIVLYGGENGEETSGKINLDGKFERGRTDVCDLEIGNALSPLSRIDIGHDNAGSGSGWFLDRVVISCTSSGIEQTFTCDKWLADDEDENVIERTLYENKSLRKTKKKKSAWNVIVFTSDVANSGTDANVLMCLYGDQGKTDDIELKTKSDVFERGDEDNFKIEAADVGKLYKMRVWHDNSGLGPGWHLDKIVIEQLATRKKYTFNCQRWLATSEDDGEIIREMPAEGDGIKKPLKLLKYNVQVVTGDKFGAGTDANVFCNVFGELGDTGDRPMKKSKTNRNKFERKAIDEFVVEAVSLQQVSRVRIGHDGAGAGAGWYLDKVIVREEGKAKSEVIFPCSRWLDRDEDDGQIVRELVPEGKPQLLSTTSYHVSVKTGDERSAGTDANVHIKLFGKDGDTGLLPLKQAENTKNKFERGRTDKFTLEAVDIGKIEYMKIGHDGSGPGAGWYLDSVEVDIPSRGENYNFVCHRWLADDEEDGELEIEVTPTDFKKSKPRIPYEITVTTGEVGGAGTDSNVFIRLYGKDGAKTEEHKLRNRTDNFEKGNSDKFKIEAEDVGPLTKIRIGHDGVGMFSGWFLDRVIVERFPPKKKLKRSKSKSRIDTSDDDDNRNKLKRRKSKSKLDDSDDEENNNGKLKRRKSKTSLKSESDDEEKGKLKRRKSKGKLDESDDENEKDDETTKYIFVCNRWLARGEDDGQIVRELVPTDEDGKVLRRNSLVMSEYVVRVFTGDKFRGGTDANVFLNVFGEKGDTGERRMKDSETHRNKFERNQEDVFKIEAADLGNLSKLKIRHDNSGTGASWFLDRVEVEDKKHNARYYFPCQRWLSTNEDDGQISRELVPVEKDLMNRLSKSKSTTSIRDELALETKAAMETYHVFVTTSDVRGAGTDANVYVIIFGENDDTGLINLKSSKTNKNKFERGVTDEFVVEAVHIGNIQKIRIGHDNKGGFAGWMLDKVVIDAPSLGKKWEFPCGRWLDKGEDDGQIERELCPTTTRTEEYEKHVPYEVTVHTSDVNGAGTDSDVFIVLFGMDTNTTQKSLCENKKQRKECFERKKVDKFVVELEDVGESIEKIRIGHDGSGFGAAWHLDKVEVRKLLEKGKGSRTFVFPCKRWFARKEDDGEIVRELVPAQVTEEKIGKDGTMKKKDLKQSTLTMRKYKVLVYTGDVFRAGTDANVFINIFGENGDTGERKLLKSESYTDKFERGHCDKFSVEAVDLAKIFKIKIRHDNSGFNAAWFLDKVEVVDTENETALFRCERWIGKNKDDGKLERSLYIKGYEGDTSSTSTLSTMHRSASMRSLKSIKESPRSKSGMDEPVYEGPTIPYTVKITTGKEEDMGTTANAFINIIGPKKKNVTGKVPLHLVNKTKMEPASTETFSLEAPDIGDVQKIEIGHDGVTPQEGWFIEEVEVDMPTVGKHYIFPCKCWFSKDKDDGHIVRTLFLEQGQKLQYKPKITYEVTIYTGDIQAAGTDAPITMTVFGSNGNTPEIPIDKCGERFERGGEDMIKMELEDIAPLKKLRIGHNGKGSRADWYLDKVTMRNTATGELTIFKCEDWLSKNQSDKKTVRDLAATIKGKQQIKNTAYIVTVKTADVRGGGTDANVSITIFGMNGDSGELKLKESTTHRDKFERNQSDVFKFDMLSLGELAKIRIWHDNAGFKAGWNLESVEVRDDKKDESYMFTVNRWLARDEDDKQIMREITCDNGKLTPRDNKEKIVYEISVTTTDKRDAGTHQNGWIILQGDLRSSKEFLMENSPKEKILRKGDTNTFRFSTRNVGKIESVLLGHRERPDGPRAKGSGRDVEWHCYEVHITDSTSGTKYVFPCNAWIPLGYDHEDAKCLVPKTVEEGRTTTVRNLAAVHYEVIVLTSDEKGAGTDANVSITIYGMNGDSGKHALKQKWRDLFEKGQTDKFKLEILDLGKLQKIRIEHDNAGFKNAAWLCDRVEIINSATGERTLFPCGKWLDKKKGDGELFKELYPQQT